MLNAHASLLCSKLCRHNVNSPSERAIPICNQKITAKINTLILTKIAKQPYPLGMHIPI